MKKFGIFLVCLISVIAMAFLGACNTKEEKYTFTFVTNGGSPIESYELSAGETVTEPAAPEKDMFTFDGWFADAEFETPYIFNKAMPAQNVTVYAKWKPEVSVKVSYDTRGGSEVEDSVGVVGSAFTAPANPVYEGYVFGGWYADESCTSGYTFSVFPSENLTLYAKWNESADYSYVSYYGNGKFIKTQPVTKSANFAEPELFDDSIIYSGWYEDEEMTEIYTFGGTLSQNLSLYTTYYTDGLVFSGNSVVGYLGDSQTVVVPNVYEGQAITEIGAYAFTDTSHTDSIITKVILPDSIETLGEGAFYDCNYLVEINLTENVTSIGAYAFYRNQRLQIVGDLSGVTVIPASAFIDCQCLYSITLSENLTEIGEYAFADCVGLKSLTVPSKVTKIGKYAFSGCTALKSVTIGDSAVYSSLQSVGAYAFGGDSSLESVIIYANNVPELAQEGNCGVFYGCTAVTVKVPLALSANYVALYGWHWISADGGITLSDVLVTL